MSNPFANINRVSISINNSSLISDVEWTKKDKSNKTDPKGSLILVFPKGERYEYVGVRSSVIQSMLSSESIGKFFINNIKDQYTTYKEI